MYNDSTSVKNFSLTDTEKTLMDVRGYLFPALDESKKSNFQIWISHSHLERCPVFQGIINQFPVSLVLIKYLYPCFFQESKRYEISGFGRSLLSSAVCRYHCCPGMGRSHLLRGSYPASLGLGNHSTEATEGPRESQL